MYKAHGREQDAKGAVSLTRRKEIFASGFPEVYQSKNTLDKS